MFAVVKQRMQMFNSPYKSVVNCFIHVYKSEGLKAFYRSYTTQLTMNIPFQSIHFMVYEFAQTVTNKERIYNPAAHMVSGALAGAIAAAITTPLDVCKTLLNTQQVAHANGMIEAVKSVYRIGGPWAYFRGVHARVMYQMPSTAICWSTYEFFKYALGVTKTQLPVHQHTEEMQKPEVDKVEKLLKARELPAMSGAGLYGSISFNTMHTADSSFTRRKENTILDISHT